MSRKTERLLEKGRAQAEAVAAHSKPAPPNPDLLMLLGKCGYLASFSPLHRSYKLETFQARFLPGLLNNQFRYFESDSGPRGIATWAWLSDEASEKYETGSYTPRPEEWKQGNNLWFIEFLVPFGGVLEMYSDLKKLFPEGSARSLRRDEGGKLHHVKTWWGTENIKSGSREQTKREDSVI